MRRNVLFITETPGSGRRSKDPLDGAAGRRLAALGGIDHADLLRRIDRLPLLDDWPAPRSDDHARELMALARAAADRMRRKIRGRRAVLLGRNVAAAFRLMSEDYIWFRPLVVEPDVELAVIPHRSGISEWWNDAETTRAARDLMLSVKLGFLGFRRAQERSRPTGGGRREQFSPAQVAAALEAGRGVYTWAAEALTEATGIAISDDGIKGYVTRYPDLHEVELEQTSRLLNTAKRNIIRAVEAGDVESSWKVMRSRIGQGSGFELVVNAKVEGTVDHRHAHLHAHARLAEIGLDLTRYSDEQLEAIEDFANILDAPTNGAASSPAPGRPGGMEPTE